MDAGFSRSVKMLAGQVVGDVLVRKCGYRLSEIMIFGFGQGGMSFLSVCLSVLICCYCPGAAGLAVARELGESLSGVISVGALYPLSADRSSAKKNGTPVLLVSGRDSVVVSDSAVQRTKEVFGTVQLHRYSRKGDTMPRNRDEMMPIMQFFAAHLRSRRGVPEGSVEIV